MLEKKQIALLFMATLVTQGISLLIFLVVGVILTQTRPTDNFVQLRDGTTVIANPVDPYEREPETIRQFLISTVDGLFNWTGVVTRNVNGVVRLDNDVGVPVGAGKRVPTPAYQASFAITERLRSVFLEELAALVPQGLFTPSTPGQLSRRPRVTPRIRYVGTPQRVGVGVWDVEMVVDLVVFEANIPQGRFYAPFNKVIRVRAIEQRKDAPVFPAEPTGLAYDGIEQLLGRVYRAGLEIIDFRDFDTRQREQRPSDGSETGAPSSEAMPRE